MELVDFVNRRDGFGSLTFSRTNREGEVNRRTCWRGSFHEEIRSFYFTLFALTSLGEPMVLNSNTIQSL